MASEIRVNTINNRSGLGTISITNSGAVFSGVTTFAQIKTTSGEVTVGTGASVFSPATNVLALGTNNTERVRISSAGELTHTAGQADAATFTSNQTSAILNVKDQDGDGIYISGSSAYGHRIYTNTTEDLLLGTNLTEKLRITSSGNIGIGTNNPATNFKLDVNGDLSLGEFGGTDNTYIDQKQNGSLDIINSGVAANTGRIRINRVNNISEDTTYYRDFELYDGKSNKIIEVDGSAAMTRIHMGTDKVVQFQGNIGEIGSVSGFQATNTAGSANTDFGIRATTIRFATGNSERLRIDSSGNAILKSAGAAFKAENPSSSGDYLRMYANGTAQWDIYTNGELLRIGDNSGNSSARVQFDNPTFHRSTSNTTGVAAVSAKQEVNNGGYLIYEGKNSSDTTVFSVTHNGRINLSENIVFASGQGIDFSATGGPANGTGGSELLDDYEEGTFTPGFGVSNGNTTYSSQWGKYTKVGNVVYIWFRMVATNDANASLYYLTGLPYTIGGINGQYPGPCISNFYDLYLGSNGTVLGGYWRHGETRFRFHSNGNSTGQMTPSLVANNSFEIRGEGFYPVS